MSVLGAATLYERTNGIARVMYMPIVTDIGVFDDDNKFWRADGLPLSCDIQVTIRDLSSMRNAMVTNLSLQFGTGGLGTGKQSFTHPFYLECYSRGRYVFQDLIVPLSFWLAAVCPLASGDDISLSIPLRCWSGNDLDMSLYNSSVIDFPEVWDSSDTITGLKSAFTGALDFLHLSGIRSLEVNLSGGKTGFDAVDGLSNTTKEPEISGTVNSATQKANGSQWITWRVDGRDTVGRSFIDILEGAMDGLTSNIASEIRIENWMDQGQKESVGSVFKDYVAKSQTEANSMDENNLDIGKDAQRKELAERMAQVEKNQAQGSIQDAQSQGGKAENFENEGYDAGFENVDNKEDELVAGMNAAQYEVSLRNLEYVAKAGKGARRLRNFYLEATYSTTHLEKNYQAKTIDKIRKESSNEEDMWTADGEFDIYRMINRYQTLAGTANKYNGDRKEWYSMLPEIPTGVLGTFQLANAVDGSEKGLYLRAVQNMVNTQLVYRRLVLKMVLNKQTSRYYYVKPTMHAIWAAVGTVAFAVILITPRMARTGDYPGMLRAMGTYVAAARYIGVAAFFANMYDSNLAYLFYYEAINQNSFYLHCRFGKPGSYSKYVKGQDQRGSYRLGTFTMFADPSSTGAFAQPDAGRMLSFEDTTMGGSQALNAPPQGGTTAQRDERFLGLRRYSNAERFYVEARQLKDSGWVTGLFNVSRKAS
ncbi:hypothetical protein SPFM1_00039 [Salmonella phage SPFM1]|nr:hypothetical protein SPFM1_00039 [Salmonella phage SPFM1]